MLGRSIGRAIDVLRRLSGMTCGASLLESREAIREAKLRLAKCYIDRHLGDCLSPARAAVDLGISVRTLHYLFEPTGTTFAEYVTKRRLEECRAILESRHDTQSITSIALAWGFGSLATFYRTFQRAYGVSPGRLRADSSASRSS